MCVRMAGKSESLSDPQPLQYPFLLMSNKIQVLADAHALDYVPKVPN